jgi:putative component of toxin-antitoxin plasmid stabilization module
MYNFALKEIEEIRGKLKIYKLLVNGACAFDKFEQEINEEGSLMSELRTIAARLYDIADCKSLPDTKFKDITPKNESNKEYEIKTHHLRVYLFHEKNTGRIIVCGGKKGTQQADIKHFRKIKNEYFKNKP